MRTKAQTCLETKQNRGEICSNDSGDKHRREAHQKLKEQSTGVYDQPIDAFPISYQRDERSTHDCGTTQCRMGPNGEVPWDSSRQRKVHHVRHVAVDNEFL